MTLPVFWITVVSEPPRLTLFGYITHSKRLGSITPDLGLVVLLPHSFRCQRGFVLPQDIHVLSSDDKLKGAIFFSVFRFPVSFTDICGISIY